MPTCETLPTDVCGSSKSICFQSEAKLESANIIKLADFLEKTQDQYPLYFCGVPDKEPTCAPSRPDEYNGISNADQDGDGVEDSADNCPAVFNPIRPFDNGVQADGDQDGIGDACDICPISSDNELCPIGKPGDRDLDEVLDLVDNCPLVHNPDQADKDGDKAGDACDLCVNIANPDNGACKLSRIKDLKTYQFDGDNNPVILGANVEVEGIVTGEYNNGYFVQEDPTLLDDSSDSYGIFVFDKRTDRQRPQVNEKISLVAKFSQFNGQLQLSYPETITILEENKAIEPRQVSIDEAAQKSAQSKLEGVLVQVLEDGEAVLKIDNDTDNNFSGFYLDGKLPVSRNLFDFPAPFEGDAYQVTGVLRYSWERLQIEPRSADDLTLVAQAPSQLLGFDSRDIFLEVEGTPESLVSLELDRAPLEAATISLSSTPSGVLVHDGTIQIEAGSRFIEIPVKAQSVPDELVILTAKLNGSQASKELIVVEKLNPKLIEPEVNAATKTVGKAFSFEISVDQPASLSGDGETVSAVVTPETGLLIDNPIVLNAGESQFEFSLQGEKTGEYEIDLTLNGSTIKLFVSISDKAVATTGLIISEALVDPSGQDLDLEWIEIFNGTDGTIDLSEYSLGSGGTDYTYSTVQLTGNLEPGDCFIVGAGSSSDINGNAVADQKIDFNPDFQNGGSTADGVALFKLQVSEIAADSIPTDVLIYGTTNKSELLGPTGEVIEPHTGKASKGHAYIRDAEGLWTSSAEMSPGNCDHVN